MLYKTRGSVLVNVLIRTRFD